jgi:hypothetical protein
VLYEAQRVPEEVSRFLATTHEAQRVPEEVSRFLATSAEVQLQQPEITGLLAVLVAFTLHVPVQRDGECEHEHYGGVLVLSAAGGESVCFENSPPSLFTCLPHLFTTQGGEF